MRRKIQVPSLPERHRVIW